MPEVRDPAGDVLRGFTALANDDLAQALDVLQAWVTKGTDGSVWSHVQVADLRVVPTLAKTPSFSAQYAFSFAADAAYQVHASVSGHDGGQWDCSVLDGSTDEWTDTEGYVDTEGGVVHVRFSDAAAQAFRAESVLPPFSGQAWGNLEADDEQTHDEFTGVLPYVHAADPEQAPFDGSGLVPCGLAPEASVPGDSGMGNLQVRDRGGDVERGDGDKEPAHDALADALDILAVSYTRDPEGNYWGHMRLADLTGVAQLATNPDLSLQYAGAFSFSERPRDYEFRANVGGSDFSNPAGHWDCSIHDEVAETWTAATGYIDVPRGIIHVMFNGEAAQRLASGAKGHSLDASAWGSDTESGRPQTNDRAESGAMVRGPDLPVVPLPAEGLTPCGDSLPLGPQPAYGAENPQLADPEGDVVRGDDGKTAVGDELADALDITAAWFTRDADGDYWSHMRLADLTRVEDLRSNRDLSLQYATGFSTRGNGREFQVSAVTGGSRYSHAETPWSCSVQAVEARKWTDTYGYIDVKAGIIHVRLSEAAAAAMGSGERVRSIDASAWGSDTGSGRPQTNDWAQTRTTFVGPELPDSSKPWGRDLVPCGDAPAPGAEPDIRPLGAEARAAPGPAVFLVLAIACAAAGLGRRRGGAAVTSAA